jgi:hypothetical protein
VDLAGGLGHGLGRRTWPDDLAGGLGRRTWPEDLAGGLGRRTWPEDLAGGLGRWTWPRSLGRSPPGPGPTDRDPRSAGLLLQVKNVRVPSLKGYYCD